MPESRLDDVAALLILTIGRQGRGRPKFSSKNVQTDPFHFFYRMPHELTPAVVQVEFLIARQFDHIVFSY